MTGVERGEGRRGAGHSRHVPAQPAPPMPLGILPIEFNGARTSPQQTKRCRFLGIRAAWGQQGERLMLCLNVSGNAQAACDRGRGQMENVAHCNHPASCDVTAGAMQLLASVHSKYLFAILNAGLSMSGIDVFVLTLQSLHPPLSPPKPRANLQPRPTCPESSPAAGRVLSTSQDLSLDTWCIQIYSMNKRDTWHGRCQRRGLNVKMPLDENTVAATPSSSRSCG